MLKTAYNLVDITQCNQFHRHKLIQCENNTMKSKVGNLVSMNHLRMCRHRLCGLKVGWDGTILSEAGLKVGWDGTILSQTGLKVGWDRTILSEAGLKIGWDWTILSQAGLNCGWDGTILSQADLKIGWDRTILSGAGLKSDNPIWLPDGRSQLICSRPCSYFVCGW